MRFVDLFAGLGGFHLALEELGHECVFACELDAGLRKLYQENFNMPTERVKGDIRLVPETEVPEHDVLCAGFPCQPFSKAGSQEGTTCEKWGDLFEHVLRILRHHKPSYILLENVANLENHDEGKTWARMKQQLQTCCEDGYTVESKRLSPHRYGIPQVRDRMLIVARRGPLPHFEGHFNHLAAPMRGRTPSLSDVLDENPADAKAISEQFERCINVWQEFLELFPKGFKMPSFPIWSMEFGADYPYQESVPRSTRMDKLVAFKGSHGTPLQGMKSKKAMMKALPSYARAKKFPDWKIEFIRQNRAFYEDHKGKIDPWLPKILSFPASLQKLEWNCQGEEADIWKYVIQFRASGVRVKRPTTAPSLIAMTTTQVPIIAKEKRYMTVRECARLQSMDAMPNFPVTPTAAYKALGNAVNVSLVKLVASALFAAHEPPPARIAVAGEQLTLPLSDSSVESILQSNGHPIISNTCLTPAIAVPCDHAQPFERLR